MFLRLARKTKVANLEVGKDSIIEGTVVASSLLTLPGSGTQCVYYDVLNEVFRRGARGAGRKMWLARSVYQKLAGFFLKDDTGQVWVTADGPEVRTSKAAVESGLLGTKATARYSARLVRDGAMVRIRGRVDEPRRGEPKDGLVIRPGAKGWLDIFVRHVAPAC